jgi:AraC-like DNA-binding protein
MRTTADAPCPKSGIPYAKGTIARLACAHARESGVALPPLLRQANLTPQQIGDPRARLAVRDQVRLLNLIADDLDDELLGFHLAQHCDLREFGLLYYVGASSATLFDAVRRTARYSGLGNEGIAQECIDGRYFGINLRYIGVSRHIDRHQAEFWFTAATRILWRLSGQNFMPRRVRFMHPRAEQPPELRGFFGGELEFGAAGDDMIFAKTVGDSPVVSADPYLNELLVRYCEEAIARRQAARTTFRSTIENAIVPLLPHGEVRAGQIARQLGMSQRTFTRRLAAEGVNFSTLMDQLRLDLAQRYFADGEATISQIAWLLGYQDVSAFSKAFRRWTGKSPREARNGGAQRQPRR